MASANPIDWKRVKALSFDIYGTLIDWENGIAKAARATVLGPYLPSSHQELLLAIERHDTTVQRETPGLEQSLVIAEGLRRYAAELGVVESGKLTAEQVDQACTTYGQQIGDYAAFPDTIAAMQRLGKRFKLIPLSNIDNSSWQRTSTGPLKGIDFDAVYTAQNIGSYKPDLRNFHYLLEHVKADFDANKDELVHVAQSLFHDHLPAKQMGITSVWVDRKGVMGDPDGSGANGPTTQTKFGYRFSVKSLAELADIIDVEIGK